MRRIEFLNLDQIKTRYGREGITDLPDPPLFSDDTQMNIAIAEALIDAGDQEVATIMSSIKKEFVKWHHSPDNNRAPGDTCLHGVSKKAG